LWELRHDLLAAKYAMLANKYRMKTIVKEIGANRFMVFTGFYRGVRIGVKVANIKVFTLTSLRRLKEFLDHNQRCLV